MDHQNQDDDIENQNKEFNAIPAPYRQLADNEAAEHRAPGEPDEL